MENVMKKKCLVTVLCLFLTVNLACSIPTRVKDYPNGFVDKETIETDDSVNFNVYDDKGEIVSVVNAKVIKDSNATYPICSIEQIKFDEQRMKTIADAIFEPDSGISTVHVTNEPVSV